jgi:hypothetical protein
MANLSKGKYAWSLSDRSGQRFFYKEMVTEWNGARVHISEYEPKHPQLQPKPHSTDPQGLPNARPDRKEPPVIIALEPDPFTTIKYSGNTYINVYSQNHGRETGQIVRFRGPPNVIMVGYPTNENEFEPILPFDGVTDIDNPNGFTITVGRLSPTGLVSDTLNYFYFRSTSSAINGNVAGGGAQNSAGPVTLQA